MRTFISGIVLKNQPIGKSHLLVTLFSPEGLVTFFAKQGQTLHCLHRESLLPLSFGNYTLEYFPPKIRSFIYGEVHHDFPEIKQAYPLLQASGKMTQAILSSQWKEKPSPELFSLFFNFLYRLHQSQNPELFSAIFLLKLLQYEGILDLSTSCSICKTSLVNTTCYRYQGQKLCNKHTNQEAIAINKEEEQVLQAIIYAKQFQELLELANFPITISDKIFHMFESSLQNKEQKI